MMRCKVLADELRRKGADVHFICRSLEGDLMKWFEASGYKLLRIPDHSSQADDARATVQVLSADTGKAAWMIVDHYDLDETWEQSVAPYVERLFVIDDLADRRHRCHALLDQNYYRNALHRYDDLVPESCRMLLGPEHVLLRDEFRNMKVRERDGQVRRVLISMGGSDQPDVTTKALEAVLSVDDRLVTDVVVGASNPRKLEIESVCGRYAHVHYHCQTSRMAELISQADLCIGAGGATTWERAVLGLPTITVVCAENQLQTTLDLQAEGAAWYVGYAAEVDAVSLADALREAMRSPDRLLNMGVKMRSLMGSPGERKTSTACELVGQYL